MTALASRSRRPERAQRGRAEWAGAGFTLAVAALTTAGFTNHIPLVVKGDVSGVAAKGRDPRERFQANARVAGPGYLHTMGIPILRGRAIEERDAVGARSSCSWTRRSTAHSSRTRDPLGRRVIFEAGIEAAVTGVVGDIHQSGLEVPPKPEFHISALQAGFPACSLAIRTQTEPTRLAAAVREAIWAVDPNQLFTELVSMEQILENEVAPRRRQATLVAAFAGLALLLAAVGLYGVLACLVSRQTQDIGLRIALGASLDDLLGRVGGRGIRLTAIGLALGIAGALALSGLIRTVLVGIQPINPATYMLVALALLGTAALASYLPAPRAMRVDPMAALREA